MIEEAGANLTRLQPLTTLVHQCLRRGLCNFDQHEVDLQEVLASLGNVRYCAHLPSRAYTYTKTSEGELLDGGVGLHADSVWARYVCIAWSDKSFPAYGLMLYDLHPIHAQLKALTALWSIQAPCQLIDGSGILTMTSAPILQENALGQPILNFTPCFWGQEFFQGLSPGQLGSVETLITLLENKSKIPDHVIRSRPGEAVVFDNHRFLHKRDPVLAPTNGQHAMRWWIR